MIVKKRILFVDDEPAILAGLQNLLYKDRKRWDMVFATGGDRALLELAKQPFEVVVSDMRMPGIDGATLLNEIKAHYPATARIMLSGHAEREAIVRALPALHQLLAKPCDAQMLRGAIERGLELQHGERDAQISASIGHIDKLRSPTEISAALERALASTHACLEDVTAIIECDPALAAKVLQLVNSAYFGAGHTTSSIRNAVSLIGLDRLRYIGSTTSVFVAAEDRDDEVVRVQAHSLKVARLAQQLVPEHGEEAYAAALLHDVGCIVPLHGAPRTHDLECDVGACLMSVWGLPASLVQIVRFHHRPDLAPPENRLVAAAVHVANARAGTDPVDREAVARAGYADRIPAWTAAARTS